MNSHEELIQTEFGSGRWRARVIYLHVCFPPPKEVQEDLQGPELVCTDWNWGLSLPSGGLLTIILHGPLINCVSKNHLFSQRRRQG